MALAAPQAALSQQSRPTSPRACVCVWAVVAAQCCLRHGPLVEGAPAVLRQLARRTPAALRKDVQVCTRGGPGRSCVCGCRVHLDAALAHAVQLAGNHDLPAIHGGVGGHGDQPAVARPAAPSAGAPPPALAGSRAQTGAPRRRRPRPAASLASGQRRSVVRVRGAKAAWRRPSGRVSVRLMGILLFSSAKLWLLLHAAMPAPRQARLGGPMVERGRRRRRDWRFKLQAARLRFHRPHSRVGTYHASGQMAARRMGDTLYTPRRTLACCCCARRGLAPCVFCDGALTAA